MFVKNMLVPWIEKSVQVVAQLSIIGVWNKKIQKKYHMRIGREENKDTLSYVDFSRLCYVILIFTELSTDFSQFLCPILKGLQNGET